MYSRATAHEAIAHEAIAEGPSYRGHRIGVIAIARILRSRSGVRTDAQAPHPNHSRIHIRDLQTACSN